MSTDTVCFDLDLIRRYDGRGPRYTSYPTALQFNDELTTPDYIDNARASNASGVPLSLYVHIPFCHTLCYYCGCNKIVTRNEERVAKYMRNLYREIELQSELFDRSRVVEQLHFGGGTPTYLEDDQMRDLLSKIRSEFTIDESDSRQFSIEVDPRTVSESDIRTLTELGFNRLSLGIQDFDATVQKACNRIQSADEVRTLVDASRIRKLPSNGTRYGDAGASNMSDLRLLLFVRGLLLSPCVSVTPFPRSPPLMRRIAVLL